ncbi:MAG: hypothetical protein IIT50_00390, partial [Bacteroidales bacterium]|nr:hypothetical protein [Bacteroidales bacterium]
PTGSTTISAKLERDLESTKTGTDKAYGTRAQGILLRYNPFQKKRLLELLRPDIFTHFLNQLHG